jgi:GTP cyclohydrolase I
MRDIQNDRDFRGIALKKVGVKGLRYPIKLKDRNNKFQNTISIVNMYVDLPHYFRGTHMSRFVEIINKHQMKIDPKHMGVLLTDLKNTLNAEVAHIEFHFPYFLKKLSPVSKMESYMSYDCSFVVSKSDKLDFIMTVKVPVHSLCPCSKEISDYGAHNQRGFVTISIRNTKMIWLEDLIEIAENSASTPLYSLLKREDEKYVTEYAYNNPKFVEDIVRDVALKLDSVSEIFWYKIEVENMESIHNHNAYACTERGTVYVDKTN